jgi:hypothetical protein
MRNIKINNWDITFSFNPSEEQGSEHSGREEFVEISTVFNGKRNVTHLVNLEELEETVLNCFRDC